MKYKKQTENMQQQELYVISDKARADWAQLGQESISIPETFLSGEKNKLAAIERKRLRLIKMQSVSGKASATKSQLSLGSSNSKRQCEVCSLVCEHLKSPPLDKTIRTNKSGFNSASKHKPNNHS